MRNVINWPLWEQHYQREAGLHKQAAERFRQDGNAIDAKMHDDAAREKALLASMCRSNGEVEKAPGQRVTEGVD